MSNFLWKFITESVEAYQRSFDRGMQMGHQRRNKASLTVLLMDKLQDFVKKKKKVGVINWSVVCFKLQDMLAWVKKRRRTIRREDLISFLCGKAPPHRSSRSNSRLAMVAPSRANSPAETGSSVEADLQPFREAIALHGEGVCKHIWLTARPPLVSMTISISFMAEVNNK